MRVRTKPVEAEAAQWLGNLDDVWPLLRATPTQLLPPPREVMVDAYDRLRVTLPFNGCMNVTIGSWLVKTGTTLEVLSITVFEQRYEEVAPSH